MNLGELDTMPPGKIVDELYKLREKRKTIEAKADLVKTHETVLVNHLINSLTKDELSKLAGKIASCSITRTVKPNVTDWKLLDAYIVKNKAWDLRNKAANAAAFRARWEDGEDIPGAEQFVDIRLNVRKI